jgi:hypothetical protein
VEEERIKSAFELAMERISELPELTPEEKAAQKEKEYGPIGAGLAVKFMNGTLMARHLPIELKRYEGEPQQIVLRELISNLCREINLENTREAVQKALKGIARIAPEKGDLLKEIEADYLKILAEFESARRLALRKSEASAMEQMKAAGISGSAVRVNLNESEQWNQELDKVRRVYDPGLDRLRTTLRSKMQATD